MVVRAARRPQWAALPLSRQDQTMTKDVEPCSLKPLILRGSQSVASLSSTNFLPQPRDEPTDPCAHAFGGMLACQSLSPGAVLRPRVCNRALARPYRRICAVVVRSWRP